MKPFHYKDIGQHGPSYRPAPAVTEPSNSKLSKQKKAGGLHKKRTVKSITLVRPNN